MKDILAEIVEHKRGELRDFKAAKPMDFLVKEVEALRIYRLCARL